MRLLIIDDSATARMALEESALQAGMDCVAVENEAAALRALARHDYQALLVDANLQSVSGLQVARNLKAGHKRLRVAIISGSIDAELSAQVAAEGFCLLGKPLTAEELSICFGHAGHGRSISVHDRETVLREIALVKAGLGEAEARDEQQYWAHRIKGMAIVLAEENLRELAAALERAAPNSPASLRGHLNQLLQAELDSVAAK